MEAKEFTVNVNGKEYILERTTFNKLPKEIIEPTNIYTNKVYLERHSDSFESILWYFTHGQLHIPLNVCPAVFEAELKFWQIDTSKLSKCCYLRYISFFENQKLLKAFAAENNSKPETSDHESMNNRKINKWETIKIKGRTILENPTSSRAAKIYVAISVLMILTSIFVVCASTHPSFHRYLKSDEVRAYQNDYNAHSEYVMDTDEEIKRNSRSKRNISESRLNNGNGLEVKNKISTNYPKIRKHFGDTITNVSDNYWIAENSTICNFSDYIYNFTVFRSINISGESLPAGKNVFGSNIFQPSNTHARYKYLDYIDAFTVVYFALELLIRFLVCSRKSKFFINFLNIIDTVALLSEFVMLCLEYSFPKQKYDDVSPLDFIEFIQILRVFRVFRILKNSLDFKILVHSLRESICNMCIMTFLLFIASLVFASIVYYFDRNTFNSIPDAMWWAIITMTTVGYGDLHPKGIVGKIVGSVCAVSGVFVLALLIPVLVNNFILFIGFSKIHAKQSEKETMKTQENEYAKPLMQA